MTPARELDWYQPPRWPRRDRTALALAWLLVALWWVPVMGSVDSQPVVDLDNTESVRLVLEFLTPYAAVVVGCIVVLCVGKAVQWGRKKGGSA